MSNMRTIRVTGRGQMKVHPDMTRIIITLEGRHKEYGETLRRSSEDTEQLRDLLSAFGFERSDLKTLNFGVDTEYETYKEKGGKAYLHPENPKYNDIPITDCKIQGIAIKVIKDI